MTTKQPATSTPRRVRHSSASTKVLEGKALIHDMQRFRKEVTATPVTARKFLMDLGVLTTTGKKKSLIRG